MPTGTVPKAPMRYYVCIATVTESELEMNTTHPRWEHFQHQTEVGIRGMGGSKAEAFAQAGIALSAIVTDPALINPLQEVDIVCEEADEELLFIDWLNALIQQMTNQRMLFGIFEVYIVGPQLIARMRGEPIEIGRHRPKVEIKGASLTALKVCQRDDGTWLTQCVIEF